jgi:hypothetical protein
VPFASDTALAALDRNRAEALSGEQHAGLHRFCR